MENVIVKVCLQLKIDELELARRLNVELNQIEKWKMNPRRIPILIMQKIGAMYQGTLDELVYGKAPIDISGLSQANRNKILTFYFKEAEEAIHYMDHHENKKAAFRKSICHSFVPDSGYLESSYAYRTKDMRANEMRISQNEFAYKTGYSRSMIKFWEDGEKFGTLDVVFEACRVIRASLDYLIMDGRPRSLFTYDLSEELIENIQFNVKRLEEKRQVMYQYT